jgi:hypothetical protein
MSTIADLLIKVSADTGPASKDISSLGSKVSKGFGKSMIPAIGLLGGLGVAAKGAADKATDLGESQNAVNVVFGKGAKTISKFSKVADKEAGLSMRQLNELVTPLGASFTNMGDSQEEAATKSVALAKRAADMASVFNVDVADALGAIQAGLRGEADPLERFGVGLSDTAVSAHAMEMGLAKTTAGLTAGDKAQARYALLMAQTNKLQGDFVNTSDSAANAARINAAEQENLTASLGAGVLPTYKMILGVISSATAFMGEHQKATKVVIGVLAGLAVGVLAVNAAMRLYAAGALVVKAATAAWTAVQWLLNAALSGNPIALVIIALVALGVAIVAAWRHSETFRNIVLGAWNAIKATTLAVFNFIKAHIGSVMAAVVMILKITPLGFLITHLISSRDKIAAVLGAIKENFSTAFSAVKGVIDGVVGTIQGAISIIGRLADAIRSIPKPHIPGAGLLGKIPGFAGGVKNFGGGLAVVGENGPELVNLPGGSSVFSNQQSRGMVSGGSGIGGGGSDGDGDVVLMVDREVLGRISRTELTRKGRRNVRLEFGTT